MEIVFKIGSLSDEHLIYSMFYKRAQRLIVSTWRNILIFYNTY